MSEGMGSSSEGSRYVARESKDLAPLSSVSVQALQRHSCCWVLCVEALEYPVFEHCVQSDWEDGHKSEDGCILQPWQQQCVLPAFCTPIEDSRNVCSSFSAVWPSQILGAYPLSAQHSDAGGPYRP